MINKLVEAAHSNAVSKGFHENKKNLGEMLCLIHSEVSEALEADRSGSYFKGSIAEVNSCEEDKFKASFLLNVKDTFEDELADILIRVFDLAGHLKIDLEGHISAKMRYNASREHKHGKLY